LLLLGMERSNKLGLMESTLWLALLPGDRLPALPPPLLEPALALVLRLRGLAVGSVLAVLRGGGTMVRARISDEEHTEATEDVDVDEAADCG